MEQAGEEDDTATTPSRCCTLASQAALRWVREQSHRASLAGVDWAIARGAMAELSPTIASKQARKESAEPERMADLPVEILPHPNLPS